MFLKEEHQRKLQEYVKEILRQPEFDEIISDETLPASFEKVNVPSFED